MIRQRKSSIVTTINSSSTPFGKRHNKPRMDERKTIPILRFARLIGRPELACLQLLLGNLSDKSISFRIKIRRNATITATPSGTGTIEAHKSKRVLLIWRLPVDLYGQLAIANSTLLLIQSEFNDAKTSDQRELTIKEMRARISSRMRCRASNPPEEHFYFDTSGNVSGIETAKLMTNKREQNHIRNRKQLSAANKCIILTIIAMIIVLLHLIFLRGEKEFSAMKSQR